MANDPSEWNFVAEPYEQTIEPFLGVYGEHAIEMAQLKPGERVLDVAAGPGTLSVRAARIVKEVVATDFADGMIARLKARIAREAIANVRVAKMNGMALELESATFDAAFSAFGLIFFPDRVRGFSELARVLRPGGRAVVIGWGPIENAPMLAAMMKALRNAVPELPSPPPGVVIPVLSLADPMKFTHEMQEGGFEDVKVERVTKTMDTGQSLEDFWEQTAQANLMIAPLRARLGARWAEVSQAVCAELRPLVGEATVKMTAEATFGFGRV